MPVYNESFTTDYIPQSNRAYYYRGRSMLIKHNIPLHCNTCESIELLECHHIDTDITNNDILNLMWLCRNCHEKLHGIRF